MIKHKLSLTTALAHLLMGLALAVWVSPFQSVRAEPAELYAAPTAQGAGDCSSWANACTLQVALTGASSGDEIWVEAGVHYPGTAVTGTFTLQSGVALYGGFAGTETARDQRNWRANVTVLSGDIDQNDLTDPTGVVTDTVNIRGDNAYHVVTGSSTDATAVLDGFVITAGQANGDWPNDNGGGMTTSAGSPSLTDINFSGNMASQAGGGMYNLESSPQLTHVIFSGNSATDGGGMYNYNSNPLVTDVIFSGNSATNNGGGMNNNWYSAPVLTRVRFHGNSAAVNGGGLANAGDNLAPVLQDVIFTHNTAGAGGGGAYNSAGNTFQMGVYTNVTFSGNTATEGGGMHSSNVPGPILTNGLFIDNSATYGGAVYNFRSTIEFINATFTGNTASSQGGAMYSYWQRGPILKNAILWGNVAPEGPEIHILVADTFVSYSDIQGCGGSGAGWNTACGTDNGGNINADPLFADVAGGDLRLQLTSPAIDAGINAAVPISVTTDLDGNPRFADVSSVPNTGMGDPPIVDMGAYEAQVNVTLEKSVSPGVVEPGQDITFTLTLSNRGSMTAAHIVVTDTMPACLRGMAFTSTLAVTDTGSIPPFIWLVHDLAPGQGGLITVSGALTMPLAAGTYTNTAVISAAGDPPAENNTAVITFTVPNVAPVFTSVPVITAPQDAPYTTTLTAQDDNGDTLTITATTLPAWLTLTDHGDGTATLSGAPTNAEVGDHGVVLRVTDSGGLAGTQAFTLTVANVNDPPEFTSTPVLTATQDVLYTHAITADDPDLSHGDALTITATTLPAWLTLTDHGDGTATLAGTPTKANVGGHTVVLRVTDSGGLKGMQTFTITVAEKPRYHIFLPLVLRAAP